MSKPFYKGSYKEDGLNGPNHGWLVGNFEDLPLNPPRNLREVEIKYWEFAVGPTAHGLKESETVECTFILKGITKAIINNEEITLRAGDYVVIKPKTPNNLVAEILEDATGLTIKAPSDPNAKTILES